MFACSRRRFLKDPPIPHACLDGFDGLSHRLIFRLGVYACRHFGRCVTKKMLRTFHVARPDAACGEGAAEASEGEGRDCRDGLIGTFCGFL